MMMSREPGARVHGFFGFYDGMECYDRNSGKLDEKDPCFCDNGSIVFFSGFCGAMNRIAGERGQSLIITPHEDVHPESPPDVLKA